MYEKTNIFAKILRKEIPCDIVYEDEWVLFFNDIRPIAKVHILGIPKMDVTDFGDFVEKADSQTIKHFFSKAHDIIKEKKIEKTGFKIITNSGEDARQEVPHFHIHILGGEKLNHFV
jgi:diadenosine tetraphosphate (Ap4A) HIT family hydrolase